MKTFIKTSFVIILFCSLLFVGQAARWNHLSGPKSDVETVRTDAVEITDSLMQVEHPTNHFFYYKMDLQYVYSRGDFPFSKIQTDTIKY